VAWQFAKAACLNLIDIGLLSRFLTILVGRVVPLLPHAQHILRRRRFVIHIARIDLSAVRQQELRNLHRGGEVQRRLPVSAACVDHARIRRHQLSQLRHHRQPRRRMRIQHRSALRQKLHRYACRGVSLGTRQFFSRQFRPHYARVYLLECDIA